MNRLRETDGVRVMSGSEPTQRRWRKERTHPRRFWGWLLGTVKGLPPFLSASRLGLFVLTVFILVAVMTPPPLLAPLAFREGDLFPYEIRAFRTVRYQSEVETQRRRQEVASAVPRQYRIDPSVGAHWTAVLNDLFESVRELRLHPQPLAEKVRQLRQRFGLALPDRVFATLLQTSPATLTLMRESLLRLLHAEWQRGIKPTAEDRNGALERVRANLTQLPLTADLRWALMRLAEVALQPNMLFDPFTTERLRERARASVSPVWRTIQAGELIARRGEVVTAAHLEKLRALGYNFPAFLGTLLLALLLTAGIAAFLQMALPSVFRDDRLLALLALIWLPSLMGTRLLTGWVGAEVAFPIVATAAMMTAVLVSPFFSLFASGVFALAVTLGVTTNWQTLPITAFRPFFVTVTVGVAATFLTEKARTREQLAKVGLLLTVGTMGLQILVGTLTGETLLMGWGELQRLFLWSVLAGAMPPALTLLAVSVLERPFGVTTVFTLMELASPHAPLLRELAEKAPGTYQSSLMVARLAQEAAKRIGANDLLAWVGGLYHDIGKLSRPAYFVENLPPGSLNPHDRLSPQMSAKVLALHVQQGEELAKQHRLPQPIVDIIKEHHGTSAMTYFLTKARERGELINEADYRYSGPKPRSKESAIIMLADSVEAAVKALSDPTPEQIERVVHEVVSAKIADGQLDDAPLTLREIQEIQRALIDTLKSIYHHRIEYPKVATTRHAEPTNHHADHPAAPAPPMAKQTGS
jgi:putative nucleotidyltransferase with HDIG domain